MMTSCIIKYLSIFEFYYPHFQNYRILVVHTIHIVSQLLTNNPHFKESLKVTEEGRGGGGAEGGEVTVLWQMALIIL